MSNVVVEVLHCQGYSSGHCCFFILELEKEKGKGQKRYRKKGGAENRGEKGGQEKRRGRKGTRKKEG